MRALVALVLMATMVAADPVPAAPAIEVIVPVESPMARLGAVELAQLYSGSRADWNGFAVVPFNLPPGDALRVEFDRVVLKMSPDEVGRYWIEQRIRGGARPPRQVEDTRLVPRLVARFRGGIGYVAAGTTLSAEVRIVARLRDGKVVAP
jgi:hypothetical protein